MMETNLSNQDKILKRIEDDILSGISFESFKGKYLDEGSPFEIKTRPEMIYAICIALDKDSSELYEGLIGSKKISLLEKLDWDVVGNTCILKNNFSAFVFMDNKWNVCKLYADSSFHDFETENEIYERSPYNQVFISSMMDRKGNPLIYAANLNNLVFLDKICQSIEKIDQTTMESLIESLNYVQPDEYEIADVVLKSSVMKNSLMNFNSDSFTYKKGSLADYLLKKVKEIKLENHLGLLDDSKNKKKAKI